MQTKSLETKIADFIFVTIALFICTFSGVAIGWATKSSPECTDQAQIISRENPDFSCHPDATIEFGAFGSETTHEALVICRCPMLNQLIPTETP